MKENKNAERSAYNFSLIKLDIPEDIYGTFAGHVNNKKMNVDAYFTALNNTKYDSSSNSNSLYGLFDALHTVNFGPNGSSSTYQGNSFDLIEAVTNFNDKREMQDLAFISPTNMKRLRDSSVVTDAANEYLNSSNPELRLTAQKHAWNDTSRDPNLLDSEYYKSLSKSNLTDPYNSTFLLQTEQIQKNLGTKPIN